jgi:hypothetical protein
MEFDVNGYNDTFLTSNIDWEGESRGIGQLNMMVLCGDRWCLEPTLATIGKEKVAVPKLFYIVLSKSEKNCKMIGF